MSLEGLEARQLLSTVLTGTFDAVQKSGLPVSSTDLLKGLAPSYSDYAAEDIGGPVSLLTDGKTSADPTNKDEASSASNSVFKRSNAWTVEYTLPTTGAPNGYSITEVDAFAGNQDNRTNQYFDITLGIKTAWGTNYVSLSPTPQGLVYAPGQGNGASKAAITDTRGILAAGVVSIRFTSMGADDGTAVINNAPGMATVWRELDAFGTPTQVPAAPVVSVKVGHEALYLSWPAVPHAEAYDIYKSNTGGSNDWDWWQQSYDQTTLSYLDQYLSDGTTYYYKVVAKNVLGSGPASTVVSGKPADVAPSAPTNLVAHGGMGNANLTWTAEPFASGYNVYRSTSQNGTYTLLNTAGPVTDLAYTDTGLNLGSTYYYKVASVSSDLTVGPQSPAAQAVTGKWGAGTGLIGIYYDDGGTAIGGNNANGPDPAGFGIGKVFYRTDPNINFNWGANAPMPQMGPDTFTTLWKGQLEAPVTDYYTFYTATDDGSYLYINGQKVIDDPTYHGVGTERNTETLVPGGIYLEAGKKYSIEMRQFENGGDAAAILSWSSAGILKAPIPQSQFYPFTQTTLPTAAHDLTATATSPTTISLAWQDDNTDAIGFHLLRSTSENGPWLDQQVAGNSYTDNVAPNTTYYYKLLTFNLAGLAPAASNVASDTTPSLGAPSAGLLGSYWDNRTLNGTPALRRVDTDISWDMGNGVTQTGVINWPDLALDTANTIVDTPLNTGIPTIDDHDTISMRWQGTFTPTTTGAHTFFTRTDDDVRLWINGQRIIAMPNADNFTQGRGVPAAPGDVSPALTLTAGVAYPIMMEYNQGGGGATAELRWKGPGMSAPDLLQTTSGGQQILSSEVIAPTQPTTFTATAGAITATLRWVDTSISETAYQVEMSTDGGSTWNQFATLPAISNPNGVATEGRYFITGLTPSTTYSFRVAATNIAGMAYSTGVTKTTLPMLSVDGKVAASSGDTNLTDEGKITWWQWGYSHDTNMMNSPNDGSPLIVGVTDEGSDAALPNGVTSQRENTKGGTTVLFGEDVFAYTDRNHQWNGARFDASGVLTTAQNASDTVVPIPDYLLGGEYVSTLNGNRDNANFRLHVTLGVRPVTAYLLIDNRLGDALNTDPPTLGNGGMDWVAADGWTMVNTGISPNGQPDFIAMDEGGTISDFNTRPNANSNLGVGPGVAINNFFTIYSKQFAAGSTIDLKQQNLGSYNMYGLVIKARPGTNVTNIGTGTTKFADTTGKTFTWTGGTPSASVNATDDAIAVSGKNNGFHINIPVTTSQRQLKLYVGVDGTARGQLTVKLSDGSMLPYVDSSLVATGSLKTGVYTINYRSELPGATLSIDWVAATDGGNVILSAATMAENLVPAGPTSLTAIANPGGGIALTWADNSDNETGFKVFRRMDGGAWQQLDGTLSANSTSFTDSDKALVPGTTYEYQVRALNVIGESLPSEIASATDDVPLAPANLVAGDDGTAVRLSWTGNALAAGYNVKRGTNPGGPYTTIAQNVTTTTYSDAVPGGNTTYYYVVSAVVGGVQGSDSNESYARPAPGVDVLKVNFTNATGEDVPGYTRDTGFIFSPQVSADGVTYYNFGWDYDNTANARNRNNAGSPDERYDSLNHMQKADPAGHTWELEVPDGWYRVLGGSGDATANDSVFNILVEDRVLISGTPTSTHRFITGPNDSGFAVDVLVSDGRLTVSNGPGASNNKIDFLVIQSIPLAKTPDAPSDLAANQVPGDGIELTWTDNSNNEQGFKVERKTATTDWTEIATNVQGATYRDNGAELTTGVEYSYRVCAFNSIGNSDYTNIASAIVPLRTPTSIAATGQQSGVLVSWGVPSGAGISFVVKRADWTTTGPGAETTLATVTGSSFLDTTATVGERYYYSVATTNGTDTTPFTSTVLATAMEGSPLARVNFTATTSTGTETYPGYVNDVGDAYGDRNGLQYGWVITDSTTVTNVTGDARDRNRSTTGFAPPPDERYDSLIHMQKRSAGGTYWEFAVPQNGTYYVHVVAGDPDNLDTNAGFLFEGGTANQVATGLVPIRLDGAYANNDPDGLYPWRFVEFYATVQVEDGKLTVASDTVSPKPNPDPNTGTNGNNKIAYIDINYIPPAAGPVVVDGTAGADTYYVRREGDSVKVYPNATPTGTPVVDKKLAEVTTLTINGAAGNDTVILDYSGGSFVPSGGLTVNGGTGQNTISLQSVDAAADLAVGSSSIAAGAVTVGYSDSAISLGSASVGATSSLVKLNSLTLTGTARVAMTPAGFTAGGIHNHQVLDISGLSIADGAQLDLNDNDMILRHTDADNGVTTAGQVTSLINKAFSTGSDAWLGNGLTSSAAYNDYNVGDMVMNLAVFNNDDGSGGFWYDTFDGQSVPAGAVLVKYTYYGDTDLDGVITGSDFAAATVGWFDYKAGNPVTYMTGDFNYDGASTADDFALITSAWFVYNRADRIGKPMAAEDAPTAVFDAPIVASAPAANVALATTSPFATTVKKNDNVFLTDDIAVLA